MNTITLLIEYLNTLYPALDSGDKGYYFYDGSNFVPTNKDSKDRPVYHAVKLNNKWRIEKCN